MCLDMLGTGDLVLLNTAMLQAITMSLLWQKAGDVCLLVGCLTSMQHVSRSQGRIYSDKCTCCHTETEVADQTVLPHPVIDTRLTSPSADPITPGAWQGRHWRFNFLVASMTRTGKKSQCKRELNPGLSLSRRTVTDGARCLCLYPRDASALT